MHNNSAKSKTKFNLKITFPYILFSSLFLTQSCSAIEKEGYYRGYETPEYKIIKKFENIEIRQYEPTLVAEVMVDGDREQAANKGFRILARYIFGKNIAQEKLAMTSPVEQKKSPLSLRDTETRHDSRPALRGSPSHMQKGHTGKSLTKN
ncbi:MAG: heme-binding protein [Rickettsiales bacterium]|nr:heme-binding protein [Rickettsiales bacterium]